MCATNPTGAWPHSLALSQPFQQHRLLGNRPFFTLEGSLNLLCTVKCQGIWSTFIWKLLLWAFVVEQWILTGWTTEKLLRMWPELGHSLLTFNQQLCQVFWPFFLFCDKELEELVRFLLKKLGALGDAWDQSYFVLGCQIFFSACVLSDTQW